jgi:hypothetical protein
LVVFEREETDFGDLLAAAYVVLRKAIVCDLLTVWFVQLALALLVMGV